MEALRTIFPSAHCLESAPQHVRGAVLKGTLRYFNHHDSKWVLSFNKCTLYTASVSTDLVGVSLLLLRRGGTARWARLADDFKYGCIHGPSGTSPYVITPSDHPAATDCGVGFYTASRSKKRRFRIDAVDCVVVVNGTALHCDTLHVEAAYN